MFNFPSYRDQIEAAQTRKLLEAQAECVQKFGDDSLIDRITVYNESTKSSMCPPYWDTILCWPSTSPNATAVLPCPLHVTGFHRIGNATRRCTENGTWFLNNENKTWSDYTTCMNATTAIVYIDLNNTQTSSLEQQAVRVAKAISDTGYLVSFFTLIIAFSIMLSIKKLHCARNILHMHLFASFILRALICLIKEAVFEVGMGSVNDFTSQNGSVYFHVPESNNWGCKLFVSVWQYFITCNYSWILMEGLYLHNLIFRALFADSSNNIRWYIIMGWGLPFIIISFWVAARVFIEDTWCWTMNEHNKVFIIIAGPTMVSIVINAFIFLRISLLLFNKLRSPINDDSQRYQKWIRSTLVLVPLFGVHYVFSLAFYYPVTQNKIVHMTWLIGDRLLGSFQGFFVAILYCFLNGEVKAEIVPQISNTLRFLATNKYTRYVFPFRKKFLRSVVGRSSVCTTMSCSSLYNANGILHRNSKCRLDSLSKTKLQAGENCNHHICQMNGSRKNSRSIHRHSQPINVDNRNVAEVALCFEHNLDKSYQSEPEMNEESYQMVNMKSEF